uniref:Transmembrane protein 128 n=1 Tax=Paramormyrops kingsleyae TaxID=1676925 RepID=A0A3B3RJE9_9TELE
MPPSTASLTMFPETSVAIATLVHGNEVDLMPPHKVTPICLIHWFSNWSLGDCPPSRELRGRKNMDCMEVPPPFCTFWDASSQAVLFIGPEDKDAKPLPRFNRHSIFWIVASIGLTYYTDFFSVLMKDENIKSWWFSVGVALLGVSLAMALFSIVYLDWFRGVRQYDVQYPAIAPVTTAAFIASSCSFNIALWPVWSICTPIILFTQFMGIVMFISLLG